jgi:exodeoxyribonuclease-5
VTAIDFSTDQQVALDAILAWRAGRPRGDTQRLTLGGYAGTGKTTLVSYLVERWPNTAVCALAGKAAHVLRSKGAEARTIHSLIYVPRVENGKARFVRRRTLGAYETIIVDEASMIDHVLMHDLLSFGLPVLFVGDHGQLEPIGTNPGLMKDPDVRLERVHRQALDNPILRLATAFREGRPVKPWCDPKGRLRVAGRGDFHRLISPDVQIICGFNGTRHRVNARVRELRGVGRDLVAPGETLICLRNNKACGVFNGQQVRVLGVAREGRRTIELEVEADGGRSVLLPALRQQFGQDLFKDFRSKEVVLMDYGYCLTAHKAQGSEWPSVLAIDEVSKKWDARRWRYTVATRAREQLIYCGGE